MKRREMARNGVKGAWNKAFGGAALGWGFGRIICDSVGGLWGVGPAEQEAGEALVKRNACPVLRVRRVAVGAHLFVVAEQIEGAVDWRFVGLYVEAGDVVIGGVIGQQRGFQHDEAGAEGLVAGR